MKSFVHRSAEFAAPLALAALLTGCTSSPDPVTPAGKAPAPSSTAAEPLAQESTESSPSAPPAPALSVGESGTFSDMESDEYGENEAENTKFEVTVKAAKYVTPADVDTSEEPENGQYVLLTLTVKNVGPKPGDFTSYGMIKWDDDETAEQDATTLNPAGGQDLDATYKPGQSVTGSLVLDVVRKGGTLSYWDALGAPAFTVKLPK